METKTPKGLSSKAFQTARVQSRKKLWNFLSAKNRGAIAELPDFIKPLKVGGDKYSFGQYVGSLEDIKEFAALKGKTALKMGAVKIQLAR